MPISRAQSPQLGLGVPLAGGQTTSSKMLPGPVDGLGNRGETMRPCQARSEPSSPGQRRVGGGPAVSLCKPRPTRRRPTHDQGY
jgi:hypothetical protein